MVNLVLNFFKDTVGPDKIPGYGRVQDFAEYVVGLQHQSYLTSAQVSEVVRLWEAFSDYDKRRTHFPDNFRRREKGRYKESKRTVAPGVLSTKR